MTTAQGHMAAQAVDHDYWGKLRAAMWAIDAVAVEYDGVDLQRALWTLRWRLDLNEIRQLPQLDRAAKERA